MQVTERMNPHLSVSAIWQDAQTLFWEWKISKFQGLPLGEKKPRVALVCQMNETNFNQLWIDE